MFGNDRRVCRDLPTRENGSKHIRGNNSFRADRPNRVQDREIYPLHVYRDRDYCINYKLFNLIKMKEKKKKRPEIEDVKLENLIREVCNRLTNFTPAAETTEFFVSEILRLEDKCEEVKCKLTDI